MGHYLKDFKFYVTIMTIFCEKGGIVFKEGHYVREDIIQGNTVSKRPRIYINRNPPFQTSLHSSYLILSSKVPTLFLHINSNLEWFPNSKKDHRTQTHEYFCFAGLKFNIWLGACWKPFYQDSTSSVGMLPMVFF